MIPRSPDPPELRQRRSKHPRQQETGALSPGKVRGHKKPVLSGSIADWLPRSIRPGQFTLRKLTQELAARGIKTDVRAVWTFVHVEGLSFKNNASAGRARSPDIRRTLPGCHGAPLRIPKPSLTIRACFGIVGGIDAITPNLPARRSVRRGAVNGDLADQRRGLYRRATAGLHAGRHADLRRLHPGCRPDHSLHGPKPFAALAGMPALLPAGGQ
jgi:hypothetical protein